MDWLRKLIARMRRKDYFVDPAGKIRTTHQIEEGEFFEIDAKDVWRLG